MYIQLYNVGIQNVPTTQPDLPFRWSEVTKGKFWNLTLSKLHKYLFWNTLRYAKYPCPWVENCQNARGCFSTGDCSVHSLSTDFIGPYHGFALIRTSDIIFLLDLSIIRCFMKFFFKFERVLLATRGCPRTLKTPNSPPLPMSVFINWSCSDPFDFWSLNCGTGLKTVCKTPEGTFGGFRTFCFWWFVISVQYQ